MKHSYQYASHILAFGPHPDDVEVGCGGVLRQSAQKGHKNIIIDLSPSQFSTHGDPETRQREAVCAAEHLQVHHRENLWRVDAHFADTPDLRAILATHIRKRKPEIVLIPWTKDRHPDHEVTAQLVKNAVFYAGLQKMDLSWLPPHKPRLLVHYMIRSEFEPDLILQLSDEAFEAKMKAFSCYDSQQQTNGWWMEYIQARHIFYGNRIGCRYGEGFKLYSHAVGVTGFDCVVSGFF